MKKLLSLLLAYVFLTTESWALSGGPVFENGDTGTTIGTYAGVLVPTLDPLIAPAAAALTANSLGLFALGVPRVDLASGNFVYFTQGRTYTGVIVGVADPDTLEFRGLVRAQFEISLSIVDDGNTGTAVSTLTLPAGYANGSISCEIIPGQGFGANAGANLNTAIRIKGSASLSVQDASVTTGQPQGPITALALAVDGFKQSVTADISADLTEFGLNPTAAGAAQ